MISFPFANYTLESILLAASLLLVFSVLASQISSRYGVPVLLVFLGIGMLAGSEGPGGLDFSNYSLAFAVGSVCLAIILFDGGTRTSWKSVKPILPLGISLSTIGVLVTAAGTGLFAHYLLDMSWIHSLLLGAIVSSTDAAAVFSILRARSLALQGKLKQTLEFEAGSNDPSAIFLTTAVLAFATAQADSAGALFILFIKQAGIGLTLGWLAGRGMLWLMNSVQIEYEGLYSVLLLGLVILVFAIISALGGSGFLAVYIAGIIIGNADFLHKGSVLKFHDGIAWIAQIVVFLTLGLLSFPSALLPMWKEGILLGLFLMFVARPISILIAAPPGVSLHKRERLFVSWVGLRGAAPIILASLPWSMGVPGADVVFNLVFFVVLISVIAQGMTIPWVASKLKVTEPIHDEPFYDASLGILPAGFITVEIEVLPESTANQKRLVDTTLPSGVLLTSIEREGRFLIPKGDTVFSVGDKIRGLARPSNLNDLTQVFGRAKPAAT